MPDLDSFLKAAKMSGAADSFLVDLLRQQGWPDRLIFEAFGRHYAELTGVVIPQPKSSLESAREAFYHLLAFGTLGVWICAIGSIWFTMIDDWLPDPAITQYSEWRVRQVSWQIAAVLVSFPVFVLATRSIVADLAENPGKTASGVRRWLTNIALLITALVFIGDLVTFVAVFLQGEISSRFLAKSLVVLVLSGSVFAYYTRGIAARDAAPATDWHRRFALMAAGAIVLTLGIGFWKTGSPGTQRLLAEDRRRVQDLYKISVAIHGRWTYPGMGQGRLPFNLAELNQGTVNAAVSLRDPFTNVAYEYKPSGNGRYQICAVFSRATETRGQRGAPAWSHPAGSHCFDLNAAVTPTYSPPN